MHTQEFIRTIEPAIVIDPDSVPSSPSVLPPVGEFGPSRCHIVSKYTVGQKSNECSILYIINDVLLLGAAKLSSVLIKMFNVSAMMCNHELQTMTLIINSIDKWSPKSLSGQSYTYSHFFGPPCM